MYSQKPPSQMSRSSSLRKHPQQPQNQNYNYMNSANGVMQVFQGGASGQRPISGYSVAKSTHPSVLQDNMNMTSKQNIANHTSQNYSCNYQTYDLQLLVYNFHQNGGVLPSDKYVKQKELSSIRPKSVEQLARQRILKRKEYLDQHFNDNPKMITEGNEPTIEQKLQIEQQTQPSINIFNFEEKEKRIINIQSSTLSSAVDTKHAQKQMQPRGKQVADCQNQMTRVDPQRAQPKKKKEVDPDKQYEFFFEKYLDENESVSSKNTDRELQNTLAQRVQHQQTASFQDKEKSSISHIVIPFQQSQQEIQMKKQHEEQSKAILDAKLKNMNKYQEILGELAQLKDETANELDELEKEMQNNTIDSVIKIEKKPLAILRMTQYEKKTVHEHIKANYLTESSVQQQTLESFKDFQMIAPFTNIAERINIYSTLKTKLNKTIIKQQEAEQQLEAELKQKRFKEQHSKVKEDLKKRSEQIKNEKIKKQIKEQEDSLKNQIKKKEALQRQIMRRKIEAQEKQSKMQQRRVIKHFIEENKNQVGVITDKAKMLMIEQQYDDNTTEYQQDELTNLEIERLQHEIMNSKQLLEKQEKFLLDQVYQDMLKDKYNGYGQAIPYLESSQMHSDKLNDTESNNNQNQQTPNEQSQSNLHQRSEQSLYDMIPLSMNDKIIGLEQIDEAQKQTLAEIQYYANEQQILEQKLREQEQMLQIVMRDIQEREKLLTYVYGDHVNPSNNQTLNEIEGQNINYNGIEEVEEDDEPQE
ncbi:UNKNOWN [Stylonychia lemnae]|uniref:Uncharacterized protein n=1 Tax=Stylonychia lemnae TaxID=5949 RepID=A0A078A9F7_STYLE|nr:UNKNOWN [Stylonychia lemnae]|eukprot:CDW77423.1 UNKNOWN [Stylonychia lemnae]